MKDLLHKQIPKIQNQLLSLEQGMDNLATLFKDKSQNDPRFIRDSEAAKKKLADITTKLTNIEAAYKQEVENTNVRAESLIKSFLEKAKTVECSALTGIVSGQKGINQCRELIAKRIGETAKKANIQRCLLTAKSDDPSIEACTQEVGVKYLNFSKK